MCPGLQDEFDTTAEALVEVKKHKGQDTKTKEPRISHESATSHQVPGTSQEPEIQRISGVEQTSEEVHRSSGVEQNSEEVQSPETSQESYEFYK